MTRICSIRRIFAKKKPVSNPETRLLQDELKEIVMAAIEKLGEKHKTAILLRYEGFSYAEIAEITEASEMVGVPVSFTQKTDSENCLPPICKESACEKQKM